MALQPSTVNRTRRTLMGVAGGAVGRGAALVAPFIAIPLLYKHLGPVEFGLWTTITSVIGMAAFSDLGIGNGLLTRLSTFHGHNDLLAAKKYTAVAYSVLTAVAFGLMLLAATLLMSPAVLAIVFSSQDISPSSQKIVAVCFFLFCLGLPAGIIYRVMYARQQVWLAHLWQLLAAIASIGFCYLAVAYGAQGWVAVAAYSCAPVATMLLASIWYYRKNISVRPAFNLFDAKAARDLVRLGTGFFVLAILTSISLNVDNLILARNAGLESVASYAVPARLASLLSVIINILCLPLWSANGEALARGDTAWVKSTSRKMSLYGALEVGSIGLIFVAFDKQIMMAWVGKSFEGQRINLALLSALSVLMALTSPYFMVLNARGLVSSQIKLWAAFLIASVSAKLIFTSPQTVWAIPLISFLCYLTIVVPITYISVNLILKKVPQ